jgi:hypothetical protein
MKEEDNNKILFLSVIVSLITYNVWKPILEYFDFEIFYIGIALSQFLMALYIKHVSKPSFLTFFLFCIMLNNLLDELLFDPQKIGINEIIATVLIPIAYYLKSNNNA